MDNFIEFFEVLLTSEAFIVIAIPFAYFIFWVSCEAYSKFIKYLIERKVKNLNKLEKQALKEEWKKQQSGYRK